MLFIGSNPNIGGSEHYPDTTWEPEWIVDFFDAAYDGYTEHILDGNKARQENGEYSGAVRTWSAVRKRAEEVLGRAVDPGADFAMTEIVHCPSWDEAGVDEARDFCAGRYLEPILQVAGAQVVVALGAKNRDWFRNRYRLGDGAVHDLTIGDRALILAFLPHPTSWGPKTFASTLTADEHSRLRLSTRPER